jgi:hypothetical protein
MKTARKHVRLAIEFVNQDEVGEARAMLRQELVRQMEQMFPDLAAQDEMQALKREIETEG